MKISKLALALLLAPPALSGCVQAPFRSAAISAVQDGPAEEPFTFAAADGTAIYSGTLSLPGGSGPFPLAILLSVAGPNDRDQTVGQNRGFADLARSLARHGVASLRFDDRGVGSSTGDYFAASWQALTADALMAARQLQDDHRIDGARIGFAGMSQGAALAAMACREHAPCAFAVFMSAPGLPGEAAMRAQLEAMLAASGLPQAQVEQFRALMNRYFAIVNSTDPDRKARLVQFLSGPGRQLIPAYAFLPDTPAALADILLGEWYKSNLTFDPETAYRGLQSPVLVVGGGLDPIAPPRDHWPVIRASVSHDSMFIELPNGNHLLQSARSGSPEEYATLEHGISPALAAVIGTWVAEKTAADQ